MRLPLQVPSSRGEVKVPIAAPKGVQPLDCSDSCAGLTGLARALCLQLCQRNQ
jgi:hypothetical protein